MRFSVHQSSIMRKKPSVKKVKRSTMLIGKRALALLCAIGSVLIANISFAEANAKPNVLFIAIDDLRPVLGCYGESEVISPNIDKLAAESVQFSQAYCSVPTCGASRASLFTGLMPTANRFVDYKTSIDTDAPDVPTLPQVFKEAGYTTLSYGKIFHHKYDAEERSWSEKAWLSGNERLDAKLDITLKRLSTAKRGLMFEAADVSDEEYMDGKTTRKTIEGLRRLKKEGKPFFLGCGFKKPHMPFYVPKKYWDMYDRSTLTLANNRYLPQGAPDSLRSSNELNGYVLDEWDLNSDDWHRAMIHGYYACVSYIDAQVGKIMQELKSLGLDKNTIVVLWGDHGFHLGEHNFWSKHNTMDISLRVPLLVHVPGKMQGESNAMVSSIDIYPSLCELAGLSLPSHLQGKSFVPILDDLSQSTQESVYARFRNGDAVITDRYAFTSYSEGESMLYDHVKDPEENQNVATNPEYKEVVVKMRNLLVKSIKEAEQK